MNLLVQGGLPPVDALREQWRRSSLSSVWRYADDWYHPSVDALLVALRHGSPTERACEDLGLARADAACGIGEAIDDLTCLFTTIRRSVPVADLRALTVGWVDGQTAAAPATGRIDPGSGLHTLEHFIVLLGEAYQTAARPAEPCALLFVDVGLANLSLWERVARAAGMGRVLTEAFGAGRPTATLGGGRYVVLADRTVDAETAGRTIAHRIDRSASPLGISTLLRRPPRVWREDLPSNHSAAAALLTAHRRR